MDIDNLIKKAVNGDKSSLEGVILSIQDNIYNLALRMLANQQFAEDATQEILIKVITNLSSFRFESQFSTWVYRLSANYLISEKKVLARSLDLNFDLFKADLESNLEEIKEGGPSLDYPILLNELRISCTMAMLLCLNPSHRMAYILGDIYELEHGEASSVLSITAGNFRKKLSRARSKVFDFTSKSCGLVTSNAKCRCEKKITHVLDRGCIQPQNIIFSDNSQISYDKIKESLTRTQDELKSINLHKSITQYKCPERLGRYIETLVSEGVRANKLRSLESRQV